MKLRTFEQPGLKKFEDFLLGLKENPRLTCEDLNKAPFSSEFCPPIEVDENKRFETRLEIGRYLKNLFDSYNIERPQILKNKNLWSWLAYLWFDQICPKERDGTRKVRELARYIRSEDYTDYLRHYIAGAYEIYSLHGDEHSKIFLYTPPHKISDMVDAVAQGGQDIISSKTLIEVAYVLYWDKKSNSPKKGLGDKERPGNPRRFVKVIKQLQLTYDLHHDSITADKILKLLPPEFDEWKR